MRVNPNGYGSLGRELGESRRLYSARYGRPERAGIARSVHARPTAEVPSRSRVLRGTLAPGPLVGPGARTGGLTASIGAPCSIFSRGGGFQLCTRCAKSPSRRPTRGDQQVAIGPRSKISSARSTSAQSIYSVIRSARMVLRWKNGERHPPHDQSPSARARCSGDDFTRRPRAAAD